MKIFFSNISWQFTKSIKHIKTTIKTSILQKPTDQHTLHHIIFINPEQLESAVLETRLKMQIRKLLE